MRLLSGIKSGLPSRRLLAAAVLCSYSLLWAVANYPALVSAWWYLDDYVYVENVQSHQIAALIGRGLVNGRPIEGLWLGTYLLDGPWLGHVENQLLRLAQGGVHILAAFVAAYLIRSKTRRWTAFVFVLPFLLWSFNGEAVLWRATGGPYPIGALGSLLGAVLICGTGQKQLAHQVLGALLVTASFLMSQVAAMAGLTVWLFATSLQLVDDDRALARAVRELGWLAGGLLAGGTISFIVAQRFTWGRATLTTNPAEKLVQLVKWNGLFYANPAFYPAVIVALQCALVMVATGVLAVCAHRRRFSFGRSVLILLLLATSFLTPWAPLLLVKENWPSFRVMYVVPFALSGALVVLDRTLKARRWAGIACLLVTVLLSASYMKTAQVSSSEYVQVFRSDLSTLARLEAVADQWNVDQITVANWTGGTTNWNPYGVRFMYGDSKLSAFLVDWSWSPFIRLFSDLHPTRDEDIRNECMSACRGEESEDPFPAKKLERPSVMCICASR